jgi:predicted small integral membrane protein
MADNSTGLPVKSLSGEFVRGKLVDTGGTNEAAVSAAGRLSVDGSGVTQPVSIAATVTVDSELPAAAALADATANPTVPGVGAFLVGFNGTTWDRVRTANTGRLQVDVVTGGGSNASVLVDNAAFTDGTSSVTGVGFILDEVAGTALTENDIAAARIDSKRAQVAVLEDATTRGQRLAISAAGAAASNITQVGGTSVVTGGTAGSLGVGGTVAHDAVGTGVNPALIGGYASAAAPTDVTADGDATRIWTLRNGSQVVNLATGGTLVTAGQTTMAASLPVVIASNQSAITVDTELTAVAALADATANPTITNIAGYLMGFNGTTWDRVRTANTGRLQVDVVTGGGSNASVLVDNAAFTDGTSSVTGVGFIFDEVAGTALTENDIAAARIDSKRAQVGVIEDATTRGQRAAVSAAGALASNLAQVLGATHSATNPVFTRLTDGTAVYSNTGQTAATAPFSRITDATNTAAVIATINSLKVDASSIAGAVPSATNPLPVRLTDGAGFYASASSAPASPQFSTVTSAALGAGASVDMDHTLITNGTTGRLDGVDVASTVPLKVEIKTVNSGGTATTRVVLFAQTYSGIQWRAPFKTYITQAGAASNARFRVTVTNKDANTAADVYSTAYWDQV